MRAKNLRRVLLCACAFALCGAFASAHAGNGVGLVGQVIIGRQGNQVQVQLLNPTINNFPCGSSGPTFNFAFLTSTSGGKDMLAAVLAAKAAGTQIQIVGAGTCTIDSTEEDAAYIWML